MVCFTSCLGNDVKSVKVDGLTYKTIYLCSFKNAKITENYSTLSNDKEKPTKNGFAYVTEEVTPGDVIRVWKGYYFKDDNSSSFLTSGDNGVDATVDKIIKTYKVKVSSNLNSYTISYYEVNTYNSVSKRETLEEPTEHKIEVTKERVTIEYYTK